MTQVYDCRAYVASWAHAGEAEVDIDEPRPKPLADLYVVDWGEMGGGWPLAIKELLQWASLFAGGSSPHGMKFMPTERMTRIPEISYHNTSLKIMPLIPLNSADRRLLCLIYIRLMPGIRVAVGSGPVRFWGREGAVSMSTNRIKLIETKTLPGYGAYTDNTRRADEIRGSKDGKAGIPSLNEDNHPFRREVIAKAKADLNNFEQAMSAYTKELEAEQGRLISERDERYATRRGQLESERANAIADIDRQMGPEAHRHSSARQEFEQARSRESEIEARLGRPMRVSMVALYMPIMIIIAVCETPINRMAFELFFQETPAVSLLVSLMVGAILALFAHFSGTWARRSLGADTTRAKIGYWFGVVLLLSITAPVLYFIALMRQHFVEMLSKSSAGFDQLLSGGIANAATTIAETTMGSEGRMLLAINIAIFLVGCVVAFVRHDPHPDFEGIVHRRRKAEKRLTRIRQKYEKDIGRTTKSYDDMIANLDRQIERFEKDIERIVHEVETCREACKGITERVILHLVNRIMAYELGNRRGRGDGKIPACFGQSDELSMRDAVEGLPRAAAMV